MIQLTQDEFRIQDLIPKLIQQDTGAVVCFLGIVRGISQDGDRVLGLEYEAYPEPALKLLQQIAQQAQKEYGIQQVALVHRLGRLAPGQQILAICISAKHSQQAFEACKFVLNQLKSKVPIWKKEIRATGETWLD